MRPCWVLCWQSMPSMARQPIQIWKSLALIIEFKSCLFGYHELCFCPPPLHHCMLFARGSHCISYIRLSHLVFLSTKALGKGCRTVYTENSLHSQKELAHWTVHVTVQIYACCFSSWLRCNFRTLCMIVKWLYKQICRRWWWTVDCSLLRVHECIWFKWALKQAQSLTEF